MSLNDRPVSEQQTRQDIHQIAHYYERVVPPSTAVFGGIKAFLIALAFFFAACLGLFVIGQLFR